MDNWRKKDKDLKTCEEIGSRIDSLKRRILYLEEMKSSRYPDVNEKRHKQLVKLIKRKEDLIMRFNKLQAS